MLLVAAFGIPYLVRQAFLSFGDPSPCNVNYSRILRRLNMMCRIDVQVTSAKLDQVICVDLALTYLSCKRNIHIEFTR